MIDIISIVGENVRDCEDIDETNLPDYVKK
jgi:hypothetical protein